MKIQLYLISFILFIMGIHDIQEKINLKMFAEEAMSKSIIGADPIIVANPFSAKIYSKLDLKHPVWNKLKREELIIIPKNSELVKKLWGKQAEENGVILYSTAQEKNYKKKKLRYVLNGIEVNKISVDSIDLKYITSFTVVKDRNSEERVAFISTVEY